MSLRSLLLLGALVTGASASAQSDLPARPQVWAEGAARAGVVGPVSIGGGVAVGVEFDRATVRVGLSDTNSFPFLGNGVDATSLSVAGGAHHTVGLVRLATHAGPSLVWGTEPVQGPDDRRFVTVGAVGGVSAMINLGSYVRLGAEVGVTANSVQTTVGGGPALQVLLWR